MNVADVLLMAIDSYMRWKQCCIYNTHRSVAIIDLLMNIRPLKRPRKRYLPFLKQVGTCKVEGHVWR